MAKSADRYYRTDPWRIVESGFDPDYSLVSESIFSLANEYMGIRGFFEEGYSGPTLHGSYFNGVYENRHKQPSGYKGIVNDTQFMVNAVNWLSTAVSADGEGLDLAKSQISDFSRILDMKSGLLTRSFQWHLSNGSELLITFERILSMPHETIGAQRIQIKTLKGTSKVRVSLTLDGNSVHQSEGRCFWKELEHEGRLNYASLTLETLTSVQRTRSMMRVIPSKGWSELPTSEQDKAVSLSYEAQLAEGENASLTRVVCNEVKRENDQTLFGAVKPLPDNFESLLEENLQWWKTTWASCDITIEGDEANQQGIRFCIFQLFQTYRGVVPGSNIGAKGLTGEAYNGNAFWDTETYCLPFFIFNDMEGAKNLLKFRAKTLPQAMERARQLDCAGAFYPIATISGTECCDLWQHASLQLQASTAVSYGLWFYEKMTHDADFMKQEGIQMAIEVARMLATRGDWSQDGKHYGYYGVMGPDEFQMMVNNDFYTNYMGRFALRYAANLVEKYQTDVSAEEVEDWRKKADAIKITYHSDSLLFEQQDGFFELPHIDVDAIPITDFPLYSHWSYDHMYRNDMIKQPDVLMVMLLFNQAFTPEQLKANYEYYEPRCIHESSLSPSVHSILAGQLGKAEEAYDFFGFATRMDLDNYNRNTGEGIHTTSIAAAWMNIVYGFGGLRSDGETLLLAPSIPGQWDAYSFRIHIGSDVLTVHVDKNNVYLHTQKNTPVTIRLYGKEIHVDGQTFTAPIIGSGKE